MPSPLLTLSNLLWRGLVLLWLSLAPYAGALEASAASSNANAAVRVGVALVCFAGLAFGLARLARRSRVAAALALLSLVLSLVLAAVFTGERGPLGRGFFVLAPLVWAALAAAAAGPVADLMAQSQGRPLPAARERAGFAGAVLLLALLSVGASWRRVGSTTAMLRLALKSDPGNESVANRVAQALTAEGDRGQAAQVLKSCVAANPSACSCALPVLADYLEQGTYREAGVVLSRLGETCRAKAGVQGMLAETLADANLADAARKAADIALAANRKDPYALCAKGIVALRAGDLSSARNHLELAIEAGRGGRARMILGLALYQAGELDAARPLFEQVLKDDPTNAPALYNLALIAQVQNRYHDAREGYLGVLRLDPKNADARFNLAILAHNAKVDAEAKHDLSELAKIVPADDARLVRLHQLLPD